MNDSRQAKQQKLLELARRGKPEVIAALLNQKLQAQGIGVKVTSRDRCLLVLFESDPAPEARAIASLMRKIATQLHSEYIEKIKICGRRRGDELPAWMDTLEIKDSQRVADELSAWLESVQVREPFSGFVPVVEQTSAVAGQRFLQVQLAQAETALLSVEYIKEVLSLTAAKLLPVPHLPASVLGLHNWRGQMLWIVDLNDLLGLSSLWQGLNSQGAFDTIILQVERQVLGLAVQQVGNIEQYAWQNLQPPTGLFPPAMSSFVEGYISEIRSIVLSAPALVGTPLWKNHELKTIV